MGFIQDKRYYVHYLESNKKRIRDERTETNGGKRNSEWNCN